MLTSPLHRFVVVSPAFLLSILSLLGSSSFTLIRMSSLDVAGVIGTWVGAGIGIVALIGIIGPLLVWRATRTERFKAIAAVGEDSHGFISHGIPIWPNIRIFRRVRVPMLKREPDFSSKKFAWDLGELPEKGSASSWVELGALL